MLEVHRVRSVDWKPTAVVALATSIDESQVAVAREDGSIEIWIVAPGSVGWHCQLHLHRSGTWDVPNSRLGAGRRLLYSFILGDCYRFLCTRCPVATEMKWDPIAIGYSNMCARRPHGD
eukprot:Gb_23587 [translate_table: standard]